jgi:hypothetical protein
MFLSLALTLVSISFTGTAPYIHLGIFDAKSEPMTGRCPTMEAENSSRRTAPT